MRRALLSVFAAIVLAAPAAALEVPFLSGRINDEARLFDARTTASLESKLKDYESRTGRQLVVLTIPSLEGASLEEFSLKVARTWKLGRKGADDGVLLLVARDDHKVRIEVGYGLEGILPDAQCGRIIRDAIVPRFRGGDFAGGATAGVDAVLSTLGDGGGAPAARVGSLLSGMRPQDWGLAGFLMLIILLSEIPLVFETSFQSLPQFLILSFLLAMELSGRTTATVGEAFLAVHIGVLLVLEWLVGHTGRGRALAERARKKRPWLNGFIDPVPSGGSGGGSWSGGGSSGGGFSGGGGSFGGGGASGSW